MTDRDKPKSDAKDTPIDLTRADDTLDGGAILRLLDRPLSDKDLQDATARIARPLEPPEKQVVRVLLFRVADEQLALDARHVGEVTRVVPVHGIPHRANKTVRGLCNIDGELLLCADLANLLELNGGRREGLSDASESGRMIVIGEEPNLWVLEVDDVEGVIAVDPGTFKRPPVTVSEALGASTTDLIPVGKTIAALLDGELLISGFEAALR